MLTTSVLMLRIGRSTLRHFVYFLDKMYVVNVVIYIFASLLNRLIRLLLTEFGFGKFFPDSMLNVREGANKQVISSQADSLIKISRIWADFFPANTSNQPI